MIRIGITDDPRPNRTVDAYTRWIHRYDASVDVVKLSSESRNEHLVSGINGLILTGGGDINPVHYGMNDEAGQAKEVSDERDEFEFNVIEKALDAEVPILGICRGMQIMNVYLGGSLIVDLPTAGFHGHVRREPADALHGLEPVPGTLLESIVGPGSHRVNSTHHQSVDVPGKGLIVSARSEGVTEAAEWVLKDGMPFLLLVQWHPERTDEHEDACSVNIARHFLKEVSRFSVSSKNQPTLEKETERRHHG